MGTNILVKDVYALLRLYRLQVALRPDVAEQTRTLLTKLAA